MTRENLIKKIKDILHYELSGDSSSPRKRKESFNNYSKKLLKYYWCGKIGYTKKYCWNNENSMTQIEKATEERLERCLIIEIEQ